MVFTIDASVIKDYKTRIQKIYLKTTTQGVANLSNRGLNTSGLFQLPQGIVLELGFNYAAAGTAVKKGELYVYCYIQKASGSITDNKIVVIDDYVYDNSDPHWIGEIPVEDGDSLQFNWFSSNANLTFILLSGYMIKV